MQIIPNFWPIALVTCAIALTACGARETSPPGPAAAPNATMAETTGGSKGRPQFQLRRVGEFNEPVAVTQPPGDERLAVVERTGRLLLARAGRSERVLVDLRDAVSTGSEQGLLGVAFHPDFAANRRLFVNYTDQDGDSHVDEYDAGPRDATGSATRVREVLEIDQPYENHNGGNLVFGPDGYLYIGFGDGGSGGDPEGRAQDPGELLGKMLRIDIDSAKPYVAPDDNPFADATPGRDEIWATGLRNPWRYSFDRATGDLYIADVGQGEWEEIDLQRADAHGGANYGWNVREGLVPYDGNGTLQGRRPTDPVHAYSHADGCSITGGYVYRGDAIPSLRGWYLFADYCADWIRGFRVDGQARKPSGPSAYRASEFRGVGQISSFGEDADGELYVTATDGPIYQLVPAR